MNKLFVLSLSIVTKLLPIISPSLDLICKRALLGSILQTGELTLKGSAIDVLGSNTTHDAIPFLNQGMKLFTLLR